MGNAEDIARAALRQSVSENRQQTAITDESRVLLADLIEERMRIAVAEGIEAVLTSEKMWTKVFAVLQKQARERTGNFVLGGLATALRRLVWIGAFALIAYGVGGWALVKAAWAAMNRG